MQPGPTSPTHRPPPPPLRREEVRALAGRVAADHRHGFAQALAHRTAAELAGALGMGLPPLPAGLSPLPLGGDAQALAGRLGAALAAHPPQDAASLLGALYSGTLPPDVRARLGIFYTPPPIVAHMLDMAEAAGVDWRQARCLDPSAGGGAFVAGMIGRIRRALAGTAPALVLRQIAARLAGRDIDPFGAWLAQFAAHLSVHDLERAAGRRLGTIVRVVDSLAPADAAERFDLVASNVPFGRVRLTPSMRARYARGTYGHANLYGLFLDAALRQLAPDGVVAFVMPTSMLSGLYFQALRSLVRAEAPPDRIAFLTARSGVFDDALQETMLATFRQGRTARDGAVALLAQDRDGHVAATPVGRFALPDDPAAPWIIPRIPAEAPLAARLRDMPARLADYGYRVATGPLVWNRHKGQLRARATRGALPVIWAEAVTRHGRFAWRLQRRGHAGWFVPDLPRDGWLLARRPCVLVQRTTAKEQDRRLVAAELPAAFIARRGAVVVENHLNMILPRDDAVPAVPLAALAALLNSGAADRAFRCISGSVAVSAFELAALPLPGREAMARIAALVAAGADPAPAIDAAYGDG